LKNEAKELKEVYKEIGSGEEFLNDIKENILSLKKKVRDREFKTFLSGRFDKNDALVEVSSDVGGRDAEDFVAMLFRMYTRYAERKNFKAELISASYGEEGGPEGRVGMKNFSLKIKGKYAFGILKVEGGAHRLVRKSPFSSASLRHTSFAQVEVFPIIDNNDSQLEFKEDELKLDTFKSSGPGGQHVNKRETAIRVTHLPSGIVASSQSERSQAENKRIAIDILKSKIEKLNEEEKRKEQQDAKQENSGSSWGNQIRNYVLHPYKLVKDLRTQIETSNVESVLDGDLDILKDDFF